MTNTGSLVMVAALGAAVWSVGRSKEHRRRERLAAVVAPAGKPKEVAAARHPGWPRLGAGMAANTIAAATVGGYLASRILGPAGLVAGVIGGGVVPRAVRRSRIARLASLPERQLAEAVDAAALAVRSGLSISQALAFAAEETAAPLAHHLRRLFEELEIGAGLEEALEHLAASVGGDDVALFVVVVSIHLRSGGNLAGALEQVSATIRHRLAVRRELRALTAQGRISGAVLGILPLLFLLFLGATSQHDLGPVYRSPVGVIMVSTGLAMEGVAYLWVRRILRVKS